MQTQTDSDSIIATPADPTVITEIQGDLFHAPPSYCLAHCVSRDLHMNKGIARLFRQRFRRVPELAAQNRGIGQVAYIKNEPPKTFYKPIPAVFYLITKEKYWGKPTYDTVEQSLLDLRRVMEEQGLRKLALPRIGCGLDRLEWSRVLTILENVFKDAGMDIRVYSLLG